MQSDTKAYVGRRMSRICVAVAGVVSVGLVLALATGARAQGITTVLKSCIGPSGLKIALPGDTLTCSIQVINGTDDKICLTEVVDRTLDTTVMPEVELRNSGDLLTGMTCVQSDGTDTGSSCPCPSGQFCCGSVLDTGQKFDVDHFDTVLGGDPDPLVDEARVTAVVLSTGMEFSPLRPRDQLAIITDLDCGRTEKTGQPFGPCTVSIAGDARVFCEGPAPGCTDLVPIAIQAAIDAAPDGISPAQRTTINVAGTCKGPLRMHKRHNLILQGIPPEGDTGCTDRPVTSTTLTSTIDDGCDSIDPSDCETNKITKSDDIKIQFLNIVNGVQSGLEFKRSERGEVFCNCIAGNREEGIELHGGGTHMAYRNLVKDNGADEHGGIRLHQDTTGNMILENVVKTNMTGGIVIENKADGNTFDGNIIYENTGGYAVHIDDSDDNVLTDNEITGTNLLPPGGVFDGVFLYKAKRTEVKGNLVVHNTGNGIKLEKSDDGKVASNEVNSNTGNDIMLHKTDDNIIGGAILGENKIDKQVVCDPGSDGNVGTNEVGGAPGQALPLACN